MEFAKKNEQLGNEGNAESDQRSFQRLPAVKVMISDLVGGKYFKEEGWTPNYVVTQSNQKVSRVNIIGIVIAKEALPSYENMVMDDGSSPISVRNFEPVQKFGNLNIGDVIMLIGRPRLYGAELYILPEITRKQDSIKWIELRRAELKFIPGTVNKANTTVQAKNTDGNANKDIVTSEKMDQMTDSEKIIGIIRNLDKGDGASFDEILANYRKSNGETIISDLMQMGEIFEIRPGRIKLLE